MSELKEKYLREIAPELQKELGCRNSMEAPRLRKIVVNMGFDTSVDKDVLNACAKDLAQLAGQKPVMIKARKSISNFKLREGMTIGAKVTLRRDRMYDFLERLIHTAFPRIRDFRGVAPGGFDGRGSYSFGLQDQTVFPEIDPDEVKRVQGMNITMVTSAADDDGARRLLTMMGMPFAVLEGV